MDGVIVCFDASSLPSFSGIKDWLLDIERYGRTGVEAVVCACKCDVKNGCPKSTVIPNLEKESGRTLTGFASVGNWVFSRKELWQKIVENLDPVSMINLRLTCKNQYFSMVEILPVLWEKLPGNVREVTDKEIQAFSAKGNYSVFLTSSKNNINLMPMIQVLAEKIALNL